MWFPGFHNPISSLQLLSCVRLFVTPWTATFQTPLNMGFYRQEYWSGLPCPPPGGLPNPGIEPTSLMSPASTSRFFTTSTSWEARICLWASFVAQQETPVQFLGEEVSLEKG